MTSRKHLVETSLILTVWLSCCAVTTGISPAGKNDFVSVLTEITKEILLERDCFVFIQVCHIHVYKINATFLVCSGF